MDYKTKRRVIVGIFGVLFLILYIFKSYSVALRVIGLVLGIGIFYFIDHTFNIKFELKHYICLMIIFIFGVILSPLYFVSDNYDKILHLLLPILGATIIFFVVNKLNIKYQWKLFITFLIIVSFLAFHEIGEYLLDKFLDLKLQGVYSRSAVVGLDAEKFELIQEKLDDTMIDMILGTLGAGIYTILRTISYYYKKHFKKPKKKSKSKKKSQLKKQR